VPDPSVHVGLVPPEPEQLRRCEPRQCAVARELEQPVDADAPLYLPTLGARALVVPEDCRPQHLVVLAKDDQPVHLARQPDRPLWQLRKHALRRAPPILRVLLGPAGVRTGNIERRGRLLHHGVFVVDDDGLDTRSADIDA